MVAPPPPVAGVVPERKTTFDTEPVLGIKVTKLFCPEEPAVAAAPAEIVAPRPPAPPIPGSM